MLPKSKKATAPRPPKYTAHSCTAVRQILSRVGDKWSVLIVLILQSGSHRFSEIKNSIEGVSQRMLTLTLRELERDGLVSRTVEPTKPPRVHYSLTPLGHTLLEPVASLTLWAQNHYAEITKAQTKFDKLANKAK